jgi:hypothetical protein
MLTPAVFLQNFPEYKDVDSTYVAAVLSRAATRMGGPDYTVWGQPTTPTTPPAPPAALTIADQAQGYYAASLLLRSPFGASTMVAKGKGKDVYMQAFEELELAVAGGFAVASRVV